MKSDELISIEDIFRDISEDSRELLNWDWDSRFGAVVTSFSKEDEEAVFSMLKKHFDEEYDNNRISAAESNVQRLAGSFGGVRAGQKLFIKKDDDTYIIFGAYWPWGNGTTVSLRIGIKAADNVTASDMELAGMVKSWFNS